MGIKRIVDVQFWNDDKVIECFSPEDKLFMLYLMTNPHTTQLGIYPINKKHMSFELGYTIDVINVLLDRFENKYNMIKYSNETKEIAIRNYLKYSIIKGGKPVEDLLMKELKQIKDKSLINYIYSSINDFDNLNETVKKILNYINDNYNDNNNDNDNEVSYNDSYNDSSIKDKHISFGEYKRIKLTQKEYDKLVVDYEKEFVDIVIQKLDEYVESNNNKNKYKNFNLVIRKAIRERWFVKAIATEPSWLHEEIKSNEREMTEDERKEYEAIKNGTYGKETY